MFIATWWKYLKKHLRLPRLYFGVLPAAAPAGAWLLFPYHPTLLRCGLAGILEIKSTADPGLDTHLTSLRTLLERIASVALESEERSGLITTFYQELQQLKNNRSWEELFRNPAQRAVLSKLGQQLDEQIDQQEKWLENTATDSCTLERLNEQLVMLKDITWCLRQELLENCQKIQDLAGIQQHEQPSSALLQKLRQLNSIFNILDRIEVRGRDSAGLVCLLEVDNLANFYAQLRAQGLLAEFERRCQLVNLVHGSIRVQSTPPSVAFVLKVSAEIGQLGDNVRRLRALVQQDRLLLQALELAGPTTILSHTRWASNGMINIPNCHPLDNEALYPENGEAHNSRQPRIRSWIQAHPHYPQGNGHVYVVLNGDIDNYPQLREQFEKQSGGCIAPQITTDAKIIALSIESHLLAGCSLSEAFRRAVASFEGSHAIAMQSDLAPHTLFLALKGSGQAIYVGLAPERFVIASEVYGLVEETERYFALDGETRREPDNPATQGQIVVLRGQEEATHITGYWYDGTALEITPRQFKKAEITTRDLDRRGFDHFFLKEIHEAPDSIQRTLRGKCVLHQGVPLLQLDEQTIYPELCQALQQKQIKRIFCMGQGTASIAASTIAFVMERFLAGQELVIRGCKASEFSGFHLQPDMQDSLVIAVTQSGTTTDTNRAVDMARARGAHTIAIVNRRNSHVTEKVHGVLYTSDGRDIEMSVASTKAFYAQVVAGALLALRCAQLLQSLDTDTLHKELLALRQLPELLQKVLADTRAIEQAASLAGQRKHWAVVGSGPNQIAAREVRIKLSELCYKSIACDFIEDKKHIDLSSEPLIIVCTAGTPENVMADVVKDVAIFKAHKALPIVITHVGEERFQNYAQAVLYVPRANPLLSIILNTMVGHLWGYYAARTIDQYTNFFNSIRNLITKALEQQEQAFPLLMDPDMQLQLEQSLVEFHRYKRGGNFCGILNPATCTDLALLMKYVSGKAPLADFAMEFGYPPHPDRIMQEFVAKLGQAVDELARPIDAIKHQAKTVTVGTSRLEELPPGLLFDHLRKLRIRCQALSYSILTRLKALQGAIAQVAGWIHYQVQGLDPLGKPCADSTLQIKDRGGICCQLASQVEHNPSLVGTKRSVVSKKELYVGIGQKDGRSIIIIPLMASPQRVQELLLLQVQFVTRLAAKDLKNILGPAYEDIKNQVVEAGQAWQDELLTKLSPQFIITQPPALVAQALSSNNSGRWAEQERGTAP